MCGIFGVIPAPGVEAADVNARLEIINDALSHRGPDDSGVWSDDDITLFHRRLAIIDPGPSGHQPLHYLNRRYTLVFNGEIYNFLELRDELRAKGYSFTTDTDSEVIAAAYDSWGLQCLDRFNGMWAFGLWDRSQKRLLLSRDRYGIKPLYYAEQDDDFTFASEVQALHKWLGSDAGLKENVLRGVAGGSRIHHGTEETYIRQVRSVPAGHNLIWADGRFDVRRWYEPSPVECPPDFNSQATVLRNLILDSCKLRLRSDVPVGTCLSGGLDSGSVASIVHRVLKHETISRSPTDFHSSFCASFPDSEFDETGPARSLANILGANFQCVDIHSPQPDRLLQAMAACDGPMPNLAFYPIWELYAFIRSSGVKVTLDGQGVDEMLGGYRVSNPALKAALRAGQFFRAWDVYRTYRSQGEFRHYSARAAASKDLLAAFRSFVPPTARRLANSFRRSGKNVGNGRTNPSPSWKPPAGLDEFQETLYRQFFYDTLPMLLQQYDRCSMANGVECRMPFMDHRVVEFVFSLPNTSRVGGGFTKRILREAMRGIVPEEVRTRTRKIGFHPPQADWFRGALRDWICDTIESKLFLESPIFNGKSLRSEFYEFERNTNDPKAWEMSSRYWGPVHVTWWLDNLNRSPAFI